MNDDEKVTYFAETDARNKRIKFGIKLKDRSRHLYAIGKTGMGKSTLLENLAIQDIRDGNGLAFIDPHGKSADLLLEYIPKERINDVVYFAPFDMEYPVSFNVMEDVGPERRHLVSSGLMSAFKKIWVDAWSARMEYILNNIMLALLEYPGSTLLGVNRMLADKDFRKKVVENITDPSVRSFWVDEYAKYTDKFAAEAAPAIQNKVGQFVTNPLIRNIIGQPKSTFDIRKIMDEKKILIINLSKGRVGESNANLLGSMLITKIYLAAMSRAEMNERELKEAANFYLYVDEFQSFANESFADILSEARKYKLNLIVAHQYIEQMSEEVRAAVFGNVGTMCVFRVGAYDAEVLEKEFAPQFTAEDIVNLQKYQMYLKLMIDGVGSPPFSAIGMEPPARAEISYTKDIIAASRASFARPRVDVETEITEWHQESGGGSQGGGQKSAAGEKRFDAPRPEYRSDRAAEPRRDSNPKPYSSSGSAADSARTGDRGAVARPYASAQGGSAGSSAPARPYEGTRAGISSQQPSTPSRSPQRPLDSRPTTSSTNSGQSPSRSSSSPVPSSPYQSRPAMASSQPTQRSEQAAERSNQTAARENELRKAVSLSYLKSEPEIKNDQKQARPENVAALRDALLSVMKEAGAQMTPVPPPAAPTPATPAPSVVSPQSTPIPVPSVQQKPLEQSPAQVTSSQTKKTSTTVSFSEERQTQVSTGNPPSQEYKRSSQPHAPSPVSQADRQPQQKRVPSEVPEDVLKEMLKVE